MQGSVRIQNSSLERKITFVPITDLATNPRNARTHSARQIQEIARSIERFGFNNPVLIDERNKIIAGHGRVEAAKLLGRELRERLFHKRNVPTTIDISTAINGAFSRCLVN